MNDRPTDDTAAHLAAAAKELIAAGRNLLDQLERAVDRPGGMDDTVRRWIDLGQSAVDGFVGGAVDHSHLDGDIDDDDDDDDEVIDLEVIDLGVSGEVVQQITIDDLRDTGSQTSNTEGAA